MLLSAVTSAGFRNYATDRLGSVTATTNLTGDLATTYRYQPFGGPLSETGTGRNPYRYTGTYLDGATDLYQMGARYYQTVGRFTQADPRPSSVFEANRYAYAAGNPVNRTDPSGLVYCDINATVPRVMPGVVGSFGIQFSEDDRQYGYYGGGLGTPGASLMCSPNDASSGWYEAITVGWGGLAVQFGLGETGPFVEGGIGTPGISWTWTRVEEIP